MLLPTFVLSIKWERVQKLSTQSCHVFVTGLLHMFSTWPPTVSIDKDYLVDKHLVALFCVLKHCSGSKGACAESPDTLQIKLYFYLLSTHSVELRSKYTHNNIHLSLHHHYADPTFILQHISNMLMTHIHSFILSITKWAPQCLGKTTGFL